MRKMKKMKILITIFAIISIFSCKDLADPLFKNTERISLDSPLSGQDIGSLLYFKWEDPDYDSSSNKYVDIGKFRIVIFIFDAIPVAMDNNSGFVNNSDIIAGIALNEEQTKSNTGSIHMNDITDYDGAFFISANTNWTGLTGNPLYWVVVGFTNGFLSHSSPYGTFSK